jgi:hypothetical protein
MSFPLRIEKVKKYIFFKKMMGIEGVAASHPVWFVFLKKIKNKKLMRRK